MSELNKKYKNSILSIAIFSVAVLFLSCQDNNIETISAFSHPPGSPDVVADNIEILYSDSAVIRFKLTAPNLKMFQDAEEPYTEFSEGFRVVQYNHETEITSSLEAEYGKLYDKKSLWEARQNVVAVTQNNDTLLTDILFWDEENNKIYSDQYVKFIQKERVITGIGFESDLQMENWFIKNVRGNIEIEVDE